MKSESAFPPLDWNHDMFRPIVVGAVIFVVSWLSLSLTRSTGAVAAIWPADGILLGIMLTSFVRRPWLLLVSGLLGSIAAELAWGDPIFLCVSLPFANLIGVTLTYFVLQKLFKVTDVERPLHLIGLLALSAVASSLSGFLGAGIMHLYLGAAFEANMVTWITADALGYATLTPLLQIIARQKARPSAQAVMRELLIQGAFCAVIVCVFIQTRYPFLFFAPIALFVVTYLLELRGAAIAVVLTALVGAILGAYDRGPISLVAGNDTERLIVLQVFLASMTVSILPIAAALAERRVLALSLAAARDEALAEARRANEANRIVQMAEQIAQVGHWRYDMATKTSTWSDEMRRLFGLNGDREPSREAALSALQPDDRMRLLEALIAVERDGALRRLDVRAPLETGQRYLRINLAGEQDEAGRIVAIYGMILDITAAKNAEEVLRKAQAAAEDRAAAKADLLADVSHELRTPLASILGFSNLLKGLPNLDGDARRFSDRITTAGEGLLTAIGDILSYSSIEAHKVEITPHPMSPSGLADEVVGMLQPRADNKALELVTSVGDATPVFVVADRGRLRQVLLNLLTNAVKFTEYGKIELRVGFNPERQILRFEVADSGPGILPSRRSRLFRRYSPGGKGRDGEAGSGLGLAISKGLVEAMGGRIGVTSTVGVGSCFWIEAPVAPEPQSSTGGGQGRVLIADDLDINRELMRRSLAPLGVDITEASDGEAAFLEASRCLYDVILLDLAMSHMDGLTAGRRIREREAGGHRSTLIAVSANHPGEDLLNRLRAAGFDGFVPKPFAPADLAELVAAHTRMA